MIHINPSIYMYVYIYIYIYLTLNVNGQNTPVKRDCQNRFLKLTLNIKIHLDYKQKDEERYTLLL